MTAALSLTLDGLPGAKAELAELLARGRDLAPLMDRIGMALESSTTQRFEDEEAPDGTKWKPSRRVELEGGKTLTLTTRLRQSISYRHSAEEVEIGSNLIYAGVHQRGATIRAKGAGALHFKLPGGLGSRTVQQVVIPARPFLGVSAEDEDEIEALTGDYLLEDAA